MDSFRTTFDPSIDAFAFANRFEWTEEEREAVHDLFAHALDDDALQSAAEPAPLVDRALAAAETEPLPPELTGELMLEAARDLADQFAQSARLEGGGAHGLSGGMVASVLDYRAVNWVVPRGNGPDDEPSRATPTGRVLRDYLWGRTVAALDINAPVLLQFLVALKLPGRDGSAWVRDRTRLHWQHLTSVMPATGDPVPLALVGRDSSPLQHQQVLAFGFDAPRDDTGTLYLYDPNAPDDVSRLDFDLHGDQLTTTRDDALITMPERGLLEGFFVEAYNWRVPPRTLVATLRADPACAVAGAPVHLTCKVVNRGYHTAPEVSVVIEGDGGATEMREGKPQPLDEGMDRTFATTGVFEDPGSHTAVARVALRSQAGSEVRRDLGAERDGAAPQVTIRSNPSLMLEPARDCVSAAVPAGGRVTWCVQPASLAWVPRDVEPAYQWEAAGQRATDAAFVFTVPDTPGERFDVRCTVRAGECWSTGAVTLTPRPAAEAQRVIAACRFLHEIRLEQLVPFLDHDGREPSPGAVLPLVDDLAGAARRLLEALRS